MEKVFKVPVETNVTIHDLLPLIDLSQDGPWIVEYGGSTWKVMRHNVSQEEQVHYCPQCGFPTEHRACAPFCHNCGYHGPCGDPYS